MPTMIPPAARRLPSHASNGRHNQLRNPELHVPLDRLIEDKDNHRITYRRIDDLVRSIKSAGLIEPLLATRQADGRLRLLSGGRRLRAARGAGLGTVAVIVREVIDEAARALESLICNVQRESLGPVELARALQEQLERNPRIKTRDDLSHMLGKDKAWISRTLSILRLPEELQTQVACTQLSLSLDSVAAIARVRDPLKQEQLIDALLRGAGQQEIRTQIRKIKGGLRLGGPDRQRIFDTRELTTVTVRRKAGGLTGQRAIAALAHALEQAQTMLDDEVSEHVEGKPSK